MLPSAPPDSHPASHEADPEASAAGPPPEQASPPRPSLFRSSYSRLFPPETPANTSAGFFSRLFASHHGVDTGLEAPIVPPPPPPPEPPVVAAPEAAAPAPAEPGAAPEVQLTSILNKLMLATKFLAFLTMWQLLSVSRTEKVYLVSLFSLLVPWTGYEGAKEKSRPLLSVFHSLCIVYIPLNLFHVYAHGQVIQELLNDDTIDNSVKDEIRASGNAFVGVTVLVVINMIFCVLWTRQIMRMYLTHLQQLHENALNEFVQNQQATHGGSTTGLSPEDLAALDVITVSEDAPLKDLCVICQDGYQPGEQVRKLPCQHEFHQTCVDEWFLRSSLCPMCNANVHVGLALARDHTGDIV